ncbi:hypothetical protein D0C36_06605 [Mucilaginibacter conchicola]|uniref:DUF922 domain-containing protein n=1 Tax=Mucilaginibacter conchicola TaxID=2303333 RepID=A0A372NYK3_9SPHI|nr:hypothetical protein [Mucilaginibacter conchicola]RFZ95193.1 hypothetical protein D0C36_06605 [Mucilaginibacter conchicola]
MIKKLSILVGYLMQLPVFFAVAQQQNPALIELRSTAVTVKPTEFYLKEINDERKNKAALGRMQLYKGGPFTSSYAINFKGGSAALISFIKNNTGANYKLRPVILTINELSVNEEPAVNGAVKGSVKITLAFALEGTYVPVKLTSYNTTTTYQRPAGPAQYIEPILNKAITNGVSFFDNWVNSQADTNIKLARKVNLSFTDYDENGEGDTIYYKVDRPLKWDDFKAKPLRGSTKGAEIFSYIGYDQSVDVRNSTIFLSIALKSWVAKSACWVLPGMQTDYALNHEQRHFDITRLVTGHFKNRLKTITMAPDTYEGELNTAYLDALRELVSMQKQYDNETSHSGNVTAQEQWNNRIDKELTASGIK